MPERDRINESTESLLLSLNESIADVINIKERVGEEEDINDAADNLNNMIRIFPRLLSELGVYAWCFHGEQGEIMVQAFSSINKAEEELEQDICFVKDTHYGDSCGLTDDGKNVIFTDRDADVTDIWTRYYETDNG